MDFMLWMSIFGEDVQSEARAQGCADYQMDDFIEGAYLEFEERDRGELSIEDKVKYGNLELEQS